MHETREVTFKYYYFIFIYLMPAFETYLKIINYFMN